MFGIILVSRFFVLDGYSKVTFDLFLMMSISFIQTNDSTLRNHANSRTFQRL